MCLDLSFGFSGFSGDVQVTSKWCFSGDVQVTSKWVTQSGLSVIMGVLQAYRGFTGITFNIYQNYRDKEKEALFHIPAI